MNIKDLDKDWSEEFRLKFSQIVTRIINLNVIPNIQSQINERIPPQRGFSIYDEQNELVNFIKDLLSQSNQEIVKEILDRVDKEVIGEDLRHATNTDGERIYEQNEGNVDIGEIMNDLQKDIETQNFLKQQQRQKLIQLRQSNNLLGEEK